MPGNAETPGPGNLICHLAVPSYNEARRILRCLDSVVRSPLPSWSSWGRIAVLDGASTDGTADLVGKWAAAHPQLPVEVVVAEKRRGKADALARFHADLLADGGDDAVVVMDADTALAPGALEALLRTLVSAGGRSIVWGTDEIDAKGFRFWASSFQMAVIRDMALAHPRRPRAYGRFFAYRLTALADFNWNAEETTDDLQLARFARERGLEVITDPRAKVLVTPAGSFGDFYLQTFRFLASKKERPGSVDPPLLGTLRSVLVNLARHPLWGMSYLAYRLAGHGRWRLRRTAFTALWVPPATTKSVPPANGRLRGRWSQVLRRLTADVRPAIQVVTALRNWPTVLTAIGGSRIGISTRRFVIRTRSGLTLAAPSAPVARYPLLEVLVMDVYRLAQIDFPAPHLLRRVVDLGAHVGSFTCAVAARLPAASFTCVEPSPSTAGWLRANLQANGLSGRTTVVDAAIAADRGKGFLVSDQEGSCEASLDPSSGIGLPVALVTFEDVVMLAGGPPDIIKLDCEGGEYDAVLKSPSWCWQGVSHVFLEYHPVPGRSFEDLRTRLADLSLELVWHEPGKEPGLGMAYFRRPDHPDRPR